MLSAAGCLPLQLAVESPASDPDVVRWLIKAGASLHTEVSNPCTRSYEPSKVDVLFLAAAGADMECLEVLLGTGMESRLHDDAVLQGVVGEHADTEDLQREVFQEMLANDPEFNPDEYMGDFEMDLMEIAHDRLEDVKTLVRKKISDTFEQRALVQAYRR